MSENPFKRMSQEERKKCIDALGRQVRLSTLPDEEVVKGVFISMYFDLLENGMEVTPADMGELLGTALVSIGGFHRSASCAW